MNYTIYTWYINVDLYLLRFVYNRDELWEDINEKFIIWKYFYNLILYIIYLHNISFNKVTNIN